MVVLRNGLWTFLAASVAMMCQSYGLPYSWVMIFVLLVVAMQAIFEWKFHEERQAMAEIRERELLAAATKLMNGLITTVISCDHICDDDHPSHWSVFTWTKEVYSRRHDSTAPLPDRVKLVAFAEQFSNEVADRSSEAEIRNETIRRSVVFDTAELISLTADLYKSRDQDLTTTRLTARRVRFQLVEMLMRHAASVRMRPGQFAEILEKHGKPEALRDAIEKSKMEELVLGDAKPWRDDLLKFVLFRKADGNAPKADSIE